ncbi:transcription factor bHLH113 isoform X6 [Elaeis guineensis]|uniref:transcription factor bHLH113 isoform X6 n=1 Tax=Elaeis guineensis var. tenera TaxID=51953 RepID=UPI003C6CE9B3
MEARRNEEEEEEDDEEDLEQLKGKSFLELLGAGEGDLLKIKKKDEAVKPKEGFVLCLPYSLSSIAAAAATTTNSSSSPSTCSTRTRMLCFGGADEDPLLNELAYITSGSSLSTLSSPCTTKCAKSKGSRVENTASRGGGRRGTAISATSCGTTGKKTKAVGSSSPPSRINVKKEKLGERISALQQLVSPFGKSDTASVLDEAVGYIRFLHDQVQVLSSPYLQHLTTSKRLHENGGDEEESRDDGLTSRGLCLVPVSCTEDVASSNGADIWSHPMGNNKTSSSSPKH